MRFMPGCGCCGGWRCGVPLYQFFESTQVEQQSNSNFGWVNNFLVGGDQTDYPGGNNLLSTEMNFPVSPFTGSRFSKNKFTLNDCLQISNFYSGTCLPKYTIADTEYWNIIGSATVIPEYYTKPSKNLFILFGLESPNTWSFPYNNGTTKSNFFENYTNNSGIRKLGMIESYESSINDTVPNNNITYSTYKKNNYQLKRNLYSNNKNYTDANIFYLKSQSGISCGKRQFIYECNWNNNKRKPAFINSESLDLKNYIFGRLIVNINESGVQKETNSLPPLCSGVDALYGLRPENEPSELWLTYTYSGTPYTSYWKCNSKYGYESEYNNGFIPIKDIQPSGYRYNSLNGTTYGISKWVLTDSWKGTIDNVYESGINYVYSTGNLWNMGTPLVFDIDNHGVLYETKNYSFGNNSAVQQNVGSPPYYFCENSAPISVGTICSTKAPEINKITIAGMNSYWNKDYTLPTSIKDYINDLNNHCSMCLVDDMVASYPIFGPPNFHVRATFTRYLNGNTKVSFYGNWNGCKYYTIVDCDATPDGTDSCTDWLKPNVTVSPDYAQFQLSPPFNTCIQFYERTPTTVTSTYEEQACKIESGVVVYQTGKITQECGPQEIFNVSTLYDCNGNILSRTTDTSGVTLDIS